MSSVPIAGIEPLDGEALIVGRQREVHDAPSISRGASAGMAGAIQPRDPRRAAPDATTRPACRRPTRENTPARRSSRNASVFATSALSPASSSRDGIDRLRDQTALARDARDARAPSSATLLLACSSRRGSLGAVERGDEDRAARRRRCSVPR